VPAYLPLAFRDAPRGGRVSDSRMPAV